MKKQFLSAITSLLISAIFLTSCNNDKFSQISDSETQDSSNLIENEFNKLFAPMNLSFDSETYALKWDQVNGASFYDINIDGVIVYSNVTTNSITLKTSDINIDDNQTHLISIRAINEDGSVKSNYTSFVFDNSISSSTDTFSYEIIEDTNQCYVNGFNPIIDQKEVVNISIGGEFNGYEITGIGDNAFANTNYLNVVTFQDSIKTVGNDAFSKSYLKKLVLNEGLETIGERAFYSLLKNNFDIIIPSTVKTIAASAFESSRIDGITFASNSQLETIGEGAFSKMKFVSQQTSNKEFVIPASVTSIGDSAFLRSRFTSIVFENNTTIDTLPNLCFSETAIVSIDLPSSIKTIGDECFKNISSLKNVYVDEESNLKSIGKNAFVSCSSFAFFGKESKKIDSKKTICIPNTLETIGEGAFKSLKIEVIDFENSSLLNTIEKSAFESLTSLKSISFPVSLKNIGENAFASCSNLESVTFESGTSLLTLYNNSFSKTKFINSFGTDRIVLANSLYALSEQDKNNDTFTLDSSIKSIASGVFKNSTFTTINLNDGLEKINNEAFSNATKLTSIVFPSSLRVIGDNAFERCNQLSSISFKDIDNSSLEIIGNSCFVNSPSFESFILPDSVTSIGAYAFSVSGVNKSLKTFTISSNSKLVYIGENAFNAQSKLLEINIPNNVLQINSSTFLNCTSLSKVDIDIENSSLNSIASRAFEYSAIKSINIPNSIKVIESTAFKNCKDLQTINFGPNSFKDSTDPTIHSNTFEGCSSLVSIDLSPFIKKLESKAFLNATSLETINSEANDVSNDAFIGTAFYNNNQTGIIVYNGILISYAGNADEITLPDSIIGINPNAFEGSSVKIITIPGNLTRIDDNAFANCKYLKEVRFSGESLLTHIGDSAFENCISLEKISISDEVISIGNRAFYNCVALSSIDLSSDKLQSIGEYSFANCNSLKNVTFNNTMETIPSYAFYQNNISSLTIPKNIKVIGDYAFYKNGLAENPLIDPSMWNITPSFKNIIFEENSELMSIGKYAFAYNLFEEITLPNNIGLVLNEYCFAYSNKLISFMVEVGVTMSEGVIYGANQIKEIELPSNVLLVSLFGGQITMVPSTLEKIIISDGSTSIPDNAFSGFGMVNEIIIPHSVVTIGDYAFYGCREITSIDLTSINKIGNNAFNGCVKLENIQFGTTFEEIGDKALFATKYLDSITDEFVIVDNILIKYNGDDEVVTLPSNVYCVAGGAFSGNHKIKKLIASSSLVKLCDGAFDSCYYLDNIDLSACSFVEIELQIFDTLSTSFTVNVNSSFYNYYKDSIYWSLYEDYIVR